MRTLIAHDEAIQTWLKNAVAAAYDQFQAEPTSVLSLDDLRDALAAARRQREKADKSTM